MKFIKLTPNLISDDMAGTLAFYRDILGFEITMSVPDAPPFVWFACKSGEVELMWQDRANMAEDMPEFAGHTLGEGALQFIEMEGIRELHAKIKDKVKIVKELHVTFYGMTEFAIHDNNGNLLVFAERE